MCRRETGKLAVGAAVVVYRGCPARSSWFEVVTELEGLLIDEGIVVMTQISAAVHYNMDSESAASRGELS